MLLTGKVALVTGAGTGIGRGIALELARRGARIGINYHASERGAREVQDQIVALGSQGVLLRADVSDRRQIDGMVAAVIERFGRLDILVNNSAVQKNLGLLGYGDEDYDHLMNVNLRGYFHCIQAVIPQMKKQGFGRIINISSVHGKRPTDFDAVYSMAKGGIKMLARECAIELAPYGITVNTIAPGAVDVGVRSSMTSPVAPPPSPQPPLSEAEREERKKRGLRRFPLGRVGLPSDIGHLACYFASDESEFITGASIRADGGSMLFG
jgi:glucose 1-dehydrogenase